MDSENKWLSIEFDPRSTPELRIVHVSGRLSLETVREFVEAMHAQACPVNIVEMSGVSFMDSAGVGALVQLVVRLHRRHHRLELAGISERVRAVLDVAHVSKLFSIHATLAEAEAHVKAQGHSAS